VHPLLQAAQDGDLDTIVEIMKDGNTDLDLRNSFSVNSHTTENNTPLMIASMFGQQKAVTYFLDAGADINAQNSVGDTALILALQYNRFETAKVLIKHKSNKINVNNQAGKTALLIALSLENSGFLSYDFPFKSHEDVEEITEFLIHHGAEIKKTSNVLISLACRWTSLKIVKLLLSKGTFIQNDLTNDLLYQILQSYQKNIEDKQKIISLLMSNGLDIKVVKIIDISCTSSMPTLIYMINRNKYDLINFLIQQGIDVNVRDENGDTALMKIISIPDDKLPYHMRVDLVKLLLEHGANAEESNKGRSPLSIATQNKEKDIIHLLTGAIKKSHHHSYKWNFFISFLAGLTLAYPIIISLKYIAQLLYNAAQKDAPQQPAQETTTQDDRLPPHHGYHRWAMHYEYYLEGKYGTKHTDEEIIKAIPEKHIRKTLGLRI
jgi:ankyrin repeat protein